MTTMFVARVDIRPVIKVFLGLRLYFILIMTKNSEEEKDRNFLYLKKTNYG